MRSNPLIVFAGGGSGGHLYPSLAVADALLDLAPRLRFVFFGTDRMIDGQVLSAYSGRLIRQRIRPLTYRPWEVPGFLAGWFSSTKLCRRFFVEHKPIAVLGSGGYACAPPICEAHRAGIATALLNPDAVPGRANRMLASRVGAVFAQWPETVDHFSAGSVVRVTGCPVRAEFKAARRAEGLDHFGLDSARKVLLVTGASQGARSVNQAMIGAAAELDRLGIWDRWQLLHLTGKTDRSDVESAYQMQGLSARVVGFTKHMAAALAAADLVLARAGASTLAELTALGRPSILMPYPYHRDQHQVANARALVKLGAARMVLDRIEPEHNVPALTDALHRLMNGQAELAPLANAAQRIGTTNAATAIAEQLLEMAGKDGHE